MYNLLQIIMFKGKFHIQLDIINRCSTQLNILTYMSIIIKNGITNANFFIALI